jgi:hypothetical protein
MLTRVTTPLAARPAQNPATGQREAPRVEAIPRTRGIGTATTPDPSQQADRGASISEPIDALVDAARALAWWSHCNIGSSELYRARQASFARLRAVLRPAPASCSFELGAVVRAARVLAGCSDSNRWGVAYYERKAAFARLRGALFALDERAAGR